MTPEAFLKQPPSRYSDWFGKGDSHEDYRDVVGDGPEPLEVLQSGSMLALVWPDKIVVTGYDGGEYCHTFEFARQAA